VDLAAAACQQAAASVHWPARPNSSAADHQSLIGSHLEDAGEFGLAVGFAAKLA